MEEWDFSEAKAYFAAAAPLLASQDPAMLAQLFPFSGYRGKIMLHGDTGGHSSGGMHLSAIQRVARGEDVDIVLRDAAELLTRQTAKFRELILVRGIATPTRVDFGGGISLEPLTSALDANFHALTGSRPRFGYVPGYGFEAPAVDEAVLVSLYRMKSLYDEGEVPKGEVAERRRARHSRIADVARSLMLATSGPVTFPVAFSSFIEPAMQPGGWSMQTFLSDGPIASSAVPDLTMAVRLERALKRFKGGAEKLRLAIDVLNSAELSRDLRIAAIGYGSALDIAVLNDSDQDRGELTFRLALRAAWLLGETSASRRDAFDTATRVYRERHRAVHAGRLPDAYDGKASAAFVRKVLTAVIERGEFPQWTKLLLGDDKSA